MIKEAMSWLTVVAARLSALLAVAGSAHATFLTCREASASNIRHTVRDTELEPDRFKDFWR